MLRDTLTHGAARGLARSNNDLVGEFHNAFGVYEPPLPSTPTQECIDLRVNLMNEEFNEVCEAIEEGDLAHIAKELADLLVVTYGTARAFGINIDPVFAEVMESNMSKLDGDGRPIYRADGKVLKSDLYREADVASVIDMQ